MITLGMRAKFSSKRACNFWCVIS